MSKTTLVKIEDKGAGFVTATQDANDKQLSTERIQSFVSGRMKAEYKLQAVNNATDTRKVNPRMREISPDKRVYTLLLASKAKN